jgi:hypothetical protein
MHDGDLVRLTAGEDVRRVLHLVEAHRLGIGSITVFGMNFGRSKWYIQSHRSEATIDRYNEEDGFIGVGSSKSLRWPVVAGSRPKASAVLDHVSKLMLRPKRPYSAFFNSPISSWTDSSLDFSSSTSVSIVSVEDSSSSRTCGCGNETKQSPTLYLRDVRISCFLEPCTRTTRAVTGRTGLCLLHQQVPAP